MERRGPLLFVLPDINDYRAKEAEVIGLGP
jgi:hypothetical protein